MTIGFNQIIMPKDSSRIRGTTPKIEQAARTLRQQLTPAEAKLWSALQKRQLKGLKFRCQHPVGRFIVDFYCPACKLVIEVDGGIHNQQQTYDEARTEHLKSFGYHVVRFSNDAVINSLPEVLSHIAHTVDSLVIAKNHDVGSWPPESPHSGGL